MLDFICFIKYVKYIFTFLKIIKVYNFIWLKNKIYISIKYI